MEYIVGMTLPVVLLVVYAIIYEIKNNKPPMSERLHYGKRYSLWDTVRKGTMCSILPVKGVVVL